MSFSKYLSNERIKVLKYPYTLLFNCLIPVSFFIYIKIYFSDFLAIYTSWRDEHPDGTFNGYFNQTVSIYTDLWYISISIVLVIFITEIDISSSFYKRLVLIPIQHSTYLLTKVCTISFLFLFQVIAAYFILSYELEPYLSYFTPQYTSIYLLSCLLVRLVVCMPIFLLLIFLYIALKARIAVFVFLSFIAYIILSFITYTPFNILKNTQFDMTQTDMILSSVSSIVWLILLLLVSPKIILAFKNDVDKTIA